MTKKQKAFVNEAFAPLYKKQIEILETEIRCLRSYIALEKIRYDDLDDAFKKLGLLLYSGIGG